MLGLSGRQRQIGLLLYLLMDFKLRFQGRMNAVDKRGIKHTLFDTRQSLAARTHAHRYSSNSQPTQKYPYNLQCSPISRYGGDLPVSTCPHPRRSSFLPMLAAWPPCSHRARGLGSVISIKCWRNIKTSWKLLTGERATEPIDR